LENAFRGAHLKGIVIVLVTLSATERERRGTFHANIA